MSHKQDKTAKRKAKQKARKFHAEQHCLHLSERIADALMDLCADALSEYVDDSKEPNLVGRNILWRMGMVAWNIAVTGRKGIDDSSVDEKRADAESKKVIRDEINGLVRKKYEKFPELRTAITDVSTLLVAGQTHSLRCRSRISAISPNRSRRGKSLQNVRDWDSRRSSSPTRSKFP